MFNKKSGNNAGNKIKTFKGGFSGDDGVQRDSGHIMF